MCGRPTRHVLAVVVTSQRVRPLPRTWPYRWRRRTAQAGRRRPNDFHEEPESPAYLRLALAANSFAAARSRDAASVHPECTLPEPFDRDSRLLIRCVSDPKKTAAAREIPSLGHELSPC